MSLIQENSLFTFGQALTAIEENDTDYIDQLLASPGRLELDKAGELLIAALELDKRNIAKRLMDANANLDSQNDEGSNCLMLAAMKNNLECLEIILAKHQIDVNMTNLLGWTALMLAVYYGHADVAKALLLEGAQADACDSDNMSCLNWAAGRGRVQCVQLLLQLGRAKVNQGDQYGTSPLIWACRNGHTEVANMLLKAGADLNSIGILGWSPLLVAVLGSHTDTVRLLLQHKPNVNTCDTQRHTPLIAASKEGNVEIVGMLLKARAFVNLSDEYGHTALIQASKCGHLEVVDLLIKNHANIDHAGNDKKTALFWAVEKGNLNVVERLLQAKANLELTSKDGETCLMRAVKMRDANIVRLLLQHQARVSATDKDGDTVLHMAVRQQSATLAQLLLANPKNHHLLEKVNRAKQTTVMIDSMSHSPILPTLPIFQASNDTSSLPQVRIESAQSASTSILNTLTSIVQCFLRLLSNKKV